MAKKSVTAMYAPPNSVVLISDSAGGEVPDSMDGKLITSNDSCIAVGCRAAMDGDTAFTLGPFDEVGVSRSFSFESMIKTPNKVVAIKSVLGKTISVVPVEHQVSKIGIWVNDDVEPSEVVVGVS